MRKSNMVPFGDVTVTNHPNTPPIPMTFPMVYLFPVSKDEVSLTERTVLSRYLTLYCSGYRRSQV